jgi:CheY-like chemotaxis protein
VTTGRGLRVLVVDDEESITELVATALRYEDFQVEVAVSGRGALIAITESHHPAAPPWTTEENQGARGTFRAEFGPISDDGSVAEVSWAAADRLLRARFRLGRLRSTRLWPVFARAQSPSGWSTSVRGVSVVSGRE